MSGLKFSDIQFERELEARQLAISSIIFSRGRIDGLKGKVLEVMDQIPSDSWKSFPQLKEINSWARKPLNVYFDDSMDSFELQRIADSLKAAEDAGENNLKTVIEIKSKVLKEKRLISQFEKLEAEFKGTEKLIFKWKPSDSQKLASAINMVLDEIKKGNLEEAKYRIKILRERLKDLSEEARKLESQDLMRKKVLSSIKRVADKMGWKEVAEPHLQDENDPSSPIIYELKSYSAGKMRFSLTLERIEVKSPFSSEDGACYEQFDRFSEKLNEYGIMTKFKGEEKRPQKKPILKEKRAKLLPRTHRRNI